ncbi:uncharacterized protein K452DRAFT_362269 [Aplosporella prunicola CBS 121167]|uniref:tripeptidyl-peptidase II n=1 Tax=Aplosporella prunicola CBS 121167 TaxID=1176127 RepID=A0A6A6B1C5_9PEZI|nr:uncharacterized protein K452DRAFT_362269 [Aplosporella prunicola CBS 121167]KAF2136827.1 hypothetical protein K452DRAFT_362269 [Aplosporella prunicola CBS 121167]
MIGPRILALVAAAVVSTTASPVLRTRSPYAVKDSHNVPRSWSRLSSAPGDHMINLQIGLKQGQFDELERHLYEVSDPAHDRYGNHLSIDEVNDLIKPEDETLNLVHEWLEDMGIERANLDYSPAKDWIKVSLSVSDVERLLDTEYSVYEHENGGQVVRTPKWSLPVHLHEHVETIQPTNSFFRPTPRRKHLKEVKETDSQRKAIQAYKEPASHDLSEVCDESSITPTCLRVLYGTIDYVPQVPGQNKIGLANYLDETSNRSDVSIFLQQFRPDAVSAAYNFTIEVINDGDNTQMPNTPEQNDDGKDEEANLDAETILGISYPTPMIAYNTGGNAPSIADAVTDADSNEPYLVWVQHMLSLKDIPQVISTSYSDNEQTVPLSYARSVCRQFAQLGARGVSLLFASGDDGVGPEGNCILNDGSNRTVFLPEFPNSCPYVTNVGATKGFAPEVVAHDEANGFASGGGYSNYFAQPAYQRAVVEAYTASLDGAYKGLFNASGRAYPDLAVQGQHYAVTWGGQNVHVDGTSASTPAAAAIISLVNDALLAAGKKQLGFLNPWLYAGGWKAFNDVTSGSAVGCGVDGFPAAEGWDAATGWGSPDFKKVLEALGVPFSAAAAAPARGAGKKAKGA